MLDELDLNDLSEGSKTTLKLDITKNAMGDHWQIPLMIAKGKPGTVLGITAALHGNELNGIPTIHRLWNSIDPLSLTGTVIFCPVLNIPGFLNGTREFYDGKDLNRIMPGRETGSSSERYAHALFNKLLNLFDIHFDLHTASEGRINSYYVKADFHHDGIKEYAMLMAPQILVDCIAPEGSLRELMSQHEIPSITVELGDPNVFQTHHVKPAYEGLFRVLDYLQMQAYPKSRATNLELTSTSVACKGSQWLYTRHGGILQVLPSVIDTVTKGDVIAVTRDIFGDLIEEIESPCDGIVIGKSTYPVCQEGSRILHLGHQVI